MDGLLGDKLQQLDGRGRMSLGLGLRFEHKDRKEEVYVYNRRQKSRSPQGECRRNSPRTYVVVIKLATGDVCLIDA